jgi:hypothetical protein
MDSTATIRQLKPLQEIEEDLLQAVCIKRAAWLASSGVERVAARLVFIRALDLFNDFVLRRKIP